MNDPARMNAGAMAAAAPAATGAIVGLILGLLAGSLLATLIVRWPQGRSIVRGRSRCDGCGRPIPPWRLVPLASYAVQRGRAACCGAAIDRRHPAMEAGCAAVGALSLAASPDPAGMAAALCGWLLLTLALLDLACFWLPDRLTGLLAIVGVGSGIAGLDPPLSDRLIGGAAGWLALAAIAFAYRRARGREGLGQGDAKLLGAIGLWLGWRPLPWVVLGACGLGFLWVAARRLRGATVTAADPLPLGTLLAAAAWGTWLVGVAIPPPSP